MEQIFHTTAFSTEVDNIYLGKDILATLRGVTK